MASLPEIRPIDSYLQDDFTIKTQYEAVFRKIQVLEGGGISPQTDSWPGFFGFYGLVRRHF